LIGGLRRFRRYFQLTHWQLNLSSASHRTASGIVHFRERSRLRRNAAIQAGVKADRRRRAVTDWTLRVVGSVAIGAVSLAGFVLVRAVLSGGRVSVAELEAAMMWAGLAGAISGFVYGVVGAPLRRRGRVGAYLAGILTAAGYAAALLLIVLPKLGEPAYDSTVNWLSGIGISLVGGAALGSEFEKEAS
jgi:hypothetical protein